MKKSILFCVNIFTTDSGPNNIVIYYIYAYKMMSEDQSQVRCTGSLKISEKNVHQ